MKIHSVVRVGALEVDPAPKCGYFGFATVMIDCWIQFPAANSTHIHLPISPEWREKEDLMHVTGLITSWCCMHKSYTNSVIAYIHRFQDHSKTMRATWGMTPKIMMSVENQETNLPQIDNQQYLTLLFEANCPVAVEWGQWHSALPNASHPQNLCNLHSMQKMMCQFADVPMASHQSLQWVSLAYLDMMKNNTGTILHSHLVVAVLGVAP